MEIEKKKDRLWVTDQTPTCRNWQEKAVKLYRELIDFVESNPKYRLLYYKQKNKS